MSKAATSMKEFNVYKQVLTKYCEYLKFVGTVHAKDRNYACLQFRNGEYKNDFLTAITKKINP